MTFAIGLYKRNEPCANFLLGNDDGLFAYALNTCFGPVNQLVGSFSRHEDESKLTINALWKYHHDLPLSSLQVCRSKSPESNVEML